MAAGMQIQVGETVRGCIYPCWTEHFFKDILFCHQELKDRINTSVTRWTKLTGQMAFSWSPGSILNRPKNKVEAKMLYVSTGNLCVSQLCCCSLLDYQMGPNSQTKIHQNQQDLHENGNSSISSSRVTFTSSELQKWWESKSSSQIPTAGVGDKQPNAPGESVYTFKGS